MMKLNTIVSIGRGNDVDVKTSSEDGYVSRMHILCSLGSDGVFRIGGKEHEILIPIYGSFIGGASLATRAFSTTDFRFDFSQAYDRVNLSLGLFNKKGISSRVGFEMPKRFVNCIAEFPALLIMVYLLDINDDTLAFACTNSHYAKGARVLRSSTSPFLSGTGRCDNENEWLDALSGMRDCFWKVAKRELMEHIKSSSGLYELFLETDE